MNRWDLYRQAYLKVHGTTKGSRTAYRSLSHEEKMVSRPIFDSASPDHHVDFINLVIRLSTQAERPRRSGTVLSLRGSPVSRRRIRNSS